MVWAEGVTPERAGLGGCFLLSGGGNGGVGVVAAAVELAGAEDFCGLKERQFLTRRRGERGGKDRERKANFKQQTAKGELAKNCEDGYEMTGLSSGRSCQSRGS